MHRPVTGESGHRTRKSSRRVGLTIQTPVRRVPLMAPTTTPSPALRRRPEIRLAHRLHLQISSLTLSEKMPILKLFFYAQEAISSAINTIMSPKRMVPMIVFALVVVGTAMIVLFNGIRELLDAEKP